MKPLKYKGFISLKIINPMWQKRDIKINKKFYLFIILIAFGCDKNHKQPVYQNVSHPTSGNILDNQEIDNIILNEFSNEKNNIISLNKITDIGVAQGNRVEMFGNIVDIELDKTGNIFVLEKNHSEVRVFSKNGEYIQTVGRGGKGPGEFITPYDMIVRDDLILVLDRLLKVEIFKKSNGQYDHYKTLRIKVTPNDMCIIGDRLYISGTKFDKANENSDGSTIHVYDIDSGNLKFSFGKLYKTQNPLVRYQLSQTKLVCSEKNKMIIGVLNYLPYIYGYDFKGNLKWISMLDDFNLVDITEKNGGQTVAIGGDSKITDRYNTFAITQGGDVIVQISRITNSDEDDENSFQLITYMLDPLDGSGKLISKDLPIIADIQDSYLASYRETENKIPTVSLNNYKYHSENKIGL